MDNELQGCGGGDRGAIKDIAFIVYIENIIQYVNGFRVVLEG
jgi:hypothetical protein